MRKNFKYYALIWTIMLAAWCAVIFLVFPLIPGNEEYDVRFWVSFALIIVTSIVNLVCAYLAFDVKNIKKMFLNLSLLTISWSALITILVVGSVIMLIPNCPAWIAAVVCIIVLAFNTIAIIKASWAVEAVNNVDERMKVQTMFIKNLTVDTESILSRAKSDAVKAECKKVYEAVRYSDPMSNEALSVVEAKITIKVNEFASAVGTDDVEKAKEIADEIVILVGDRNKKIKAAK